MIWFSLRIQGIIGGQREEKRAALAGFGLSPKTPIVACDDLLAYRQTEPGARVLFRRVQSLTEAEDAGEVFRFNADAVVADPEKPFVTLSPRADFHLHSSVHCPEFNSVADQILE